MNGRYFILAIFVFSSVLSAKPNQDFIKRNAFSVNDLRNLPSGLVSEFLKYKVITIGEMHGNAEMPSFTEGLLRILTNTGMKIAVAFEFPQNLQSAVDYYMKNGSLEEIKQSSFFSRKYQDGRTSKAMVSLLKSLKVFPNLSVFCFDPTGHWSSQIRESKMAVNLIQFYKKFRPDILVVYSGNIHSQLSKGTPWDENYRPMGYELLNNENSPFKRKEILAIKIRYREGSSWICRTGTSPNCGPYNFGQIDSNYSLATDYKWYFLKEKEIFEGHNATFFIRSISTSYPFIQISN